MCFIFVVVFGAQESIARSTILISPNYHFEMSGAKPSGLELCLGFAGLLLSCKLLTES